MWQRIIIAAFLLMALSACAGAPTNPPDWSSGVEQSAPIDLQGVRFPFVLHSGVYTLNAYVFQGDLHLSVDGNGETIGFTVLKKGSHLKAILEPSLQVVGEATLKDQQVFRVTYLPMGLAIYVHPNGDTVDVGFLTR